MGPGSELVVGSVRYYCCGLFFLWLELWTTKRLQESRNLSKANAAKLQATLHSTSPQDSPAGCLPTSSATPSETAKRLKNDLLLSMV